MEIDCYELIELIKDNSINLIDIRDNYKFSQGSIKSAINIPADFLLMNPSEYLNKKQKYYLFCNYGITSKNVCKLLSNIGYQVINIRGGYFGFLRDSS